MQVSNTLRIIFTALLIDILAFTIILPLYPRILEYYANTDGRRPESFFFGVQTHVRSFKTQLLAGGGSDRSGRLDIVLFGGVLGSLFSFLQFVSSPWIGSLSDRYGRRNILLLSMIGNAVSMLLWIFSDSFLVFVLSRVVGGLTEGNVQMSIAMISDITTPETRSRGLALVGIAFSLGFTVGPPIGAYFASIDLVERFPFLKSYAINSYSSPAIFALVLIIIETIYMAIYLPETIGFKNHINDLASEKSTKDAKDVSRKSDTEKKKDLVSKQPSTRTTRAASKQQQEDSKSAQMSSEAEKSNILTLLSVIHFCFLFFFSGMEFTLTFLTHDRFHFTHAQQGKYLALLGIVAATVQGGYVRRFAHRVVSEKGIVVQGMMSCTIGLVIIGNFAVGKGGISWLYAGAVFLAFTSGTVVTTLTSLASLTIGGTRVNEHEESPKGMSANQGKILGQFRSAGQLGRSMGPLVACSGYWILGSHLTYSLGALAIAITSVAVIVYIPESPTLSATKEKKE